MAQNIENTSLLFFMEKEIFKINVAKWFEYIYFL